MYSLLSTTQVVYQQKLNVISWWPLAQLSAWVSRFDIINPHWPSESPVTKYSNTNEWNPLKWVLVYLDINLVRKTDFFAFCFAFTCLWFCQKSYQKGFTAKRNLILTLLKLLYKICILFIILYHYYKYINYLKC